MVDLLNIEFIPSSYLKHFFQARNNKCQHAIGNKK